MTTDEATALGKTIAGEERARGDDTDAVVFTERELRVFVETVLNRELIELSEWIARRFDLSDMSKVRQACQAEQIHTEIVKRIGERK